MAPDELDPILIQVTVPLPVSMIFAGLIEPAKLARWLAKSARVEPRVGGAYELAFDEPAVFTSPGRIDHLTQDVDLGFTWGAPPVFGPVMNQPELRTRVYLRLQDSPEGIDVTLEHSGWGSGEDWESARSWHFQLWEDRLHRLKEYLLREAYG